jgi:hypothetical protein
VAPRRCLNNRVSPKANFEVIEIILDLGNKVLQNLGVTDAIEDVGVFFK